MATTIMAQYRNAKDSSGLMLVVSGITTSGIFSTLSSNTSGIEILILIIVGLLQLTVGIYILRL